MPAWQDINKIWNDAMEQNYNIDADDYPFWLLTTRSMQYAWGSNVSLPMIREVADNVAGHDGILMNTGQAKDMGIDQGDLIQVESPVGTTQGRAQLRQGIMPNVLIMIGQFGHWKTPYAKDLKRPSLNKLVPMLMDLTDATGSTNDMVKVKIQKL